MLRSLSLLLFSAAALCAAETKPAKRPSAAEQREQALRVAVDVKSSIDGEIQKAIFWKPEETGTDRPVGVPLLVFLHSWSGGFEQGLPWIEQAKKRGWALIAPDFRGPNNRPQACASPLASQDILDAVLYAQLHAHIDARRVYLVGGSGGGHMALVMAARAPGLWAGVSAWVPITDLAAWHAESLNRKNNYAKMLEASCGGAPGPLTMTEYHKRSPIFHLSAAKHLPIDINAGIHDGHTGSVPVSHSLRAFNALALAARLPDRVIADEHIDYMVREQKIPAALAEEKQSDPERQRPVLFRRIAGSTRVTIFEGGHDSEATAAVEWLSRQRRGSWADFELGTATASDGKSKEVEK